MMGAADVLEVLECLRRADVPAVLDGGWGIDALVSEQTRAHDDLDVVVPRTDRARAQAALSELGFEHAPELRPGLPARLVLRGANDRRVDFHLVIFDGAGNGWQELPDGGWAFYPAEDLRAEGQIAGRAVGCINAELQLRHHLGYALTDADRHDLRLLAARFGVPLPPSATAKDG